MKTFPETVLRVLMIILALEFYCNITVIAQDNLPLEKLKAPAAPAATIINVQPTEISRPKSLKELELAVFNNFARALFYTNAALGAFGVVYNSMVVYYMDSVVFALFLANFTGVAANITINFGGFNIITGRTHHVDLFSNRHHGYNMAGALFYAKFAADTFRLIYPGQVVFNYDSAGGAHTLTVA